MQNKFNHNSVVLFHKNCLDGISAAWVAWVALEKQVDLVPVSYSSNYEELFGEDFCELNGKDVYCLDFSFNKDIVKHLSCICNLTLLDHHDSAARELKGLCKEDFDKVSNYTRAPMFGRMETVILVDQKYSGAMLAWKWFNKDRELSAPFGIEAVQDRDLWAWKIPDSKAWTATAFSYDFTVENIDMLMNTDPKHIINEGKALLRSQERNVRLLAKSAGRFKIDEYEVPVVNCNIMFASDLGSILAENESFSITYSDSPTCRLYSLRARKNGVKVNEIAERFGGGGHPGAAGFRIDFNDPRFSDSHKTLISNLKEF